MWKLLFSLYFVKPILFLLYFAISSSFSSFLLFSPENNSIFYIIIRNYFYRTVLLSFLTVDYVENKHSVLRP